MFAKGHKFNAFNISLNHLSNISFSSNMLINKLISIICLFITVFCDNPNSSLHYNIEKICSTNPNLIYANEKAPLQIFEYVPTIPNIDYVCAMWNVSHLEAKNGSMYFGRQRQQIRLTENMCTQMYTDKQCADTKMECSNGACFSIKQTMRLSLNLGIFSENVHCAIMDTSDKEHASYDIALLQWKKNLLQNAEFSMHQTDVPFFHYTDSNSSCLFVPKGMGEIVISSTPFFNFEQLKRVISLNLTQMNSVLQCEASLLQIESRVFMLVQEDIWMNHTKRLQYEGGRAMCDRFAKLKRSDEIDKEYVRSNSFKCIGALNDNSFKGDVYQLLTQKEEPEIYVCSMWKKTVKTYKTLFGQDKNTTFLHKMVVSEKHCFDMVEKKICVDKPFNCSNGECIRLNSPYDRHTWMKENVFYHTQCIFKKFNISQNVRKAWQLFCNKNLNDESCDFDSSCVIKKYVRGPSTCNFEYAGSRKVLFSNTSTFTSGLSISFPNSKNTENAHTSANYKECGMNLKKTAEGVILADIKTPWHTGIIEGNAEINRFRKKLCQQIKQNNTAMVNVFVKLDYVNGTMSYVEKNLSALITLDCVSREKELECTAIVLNKPFCDVETKECFAENGLSSNETKVFTIQNDGTIHLADYKFLIDHKYQQILNFQLSTLRKEHYSSLRYFVYFDFACVVFGFALSLFFILLVFNGKNAIAYCRKHNHKTPSKRFC
jgi:hypothetical protein